MSRIVAMFLLAVFSTVPAYAVDYSNIDAIVGSRDGPGDDYTGIGLRGSMPLGPQLYVAGSLLSLRMDNGTEHERVDTSLGIGYHMPLNRRTDFLAQVDVVNVDLDIADESGMRIGVGVRSQVTPDLELRSGIEFVDIFDSELVINLGAQYAISSEWAGFLEISEGDDFGGYLLGARYDF